MAAARLILALNALFTVSLHVPTRSAGTAFNTPQAPRVEWMSPDTANFVRGAIYAAPLALLSWVAIGACVYRLFSF